MRPLYEGREARQHSISYSSPSSEIEQTFVEELKFLLGVDNTARYALNISSSTSSQNIFKVGSSQFARSETEVTVSASFSLLDTTSNEEIAKGSRFSRALYQSSTQNIANTQAANDAQKRAAKDLARQLSLLIATAIQENET